MIIIACNRPSKSKRLLAKELKALGKVVKVSSKVLFTNPNKLVINWGSTNVQGAKLLNSSGAVEQAVDKVKAFKRFKENNINCPKWTTSRDEAKTFKFPVLCRTLTKASEGRGIVIAANAEEMVQAPLYVEYKKKRAEYRIHVFNDEVIDVQEKRKRRGLENQPDSKIRNTDNGWVFCREDVVVQDKAKELAKKAVKSLGLNFGAVDIIYNEHEDNYYVLEVNTAPGIEGTTVKNYAKKIAAIN